MPAGTHSPASFQAFPRAPTFYHKHFFSTKGKGDEEADAIEVEPEVESPAEFIHTHLPATVAIPEVWPYLPCIATSRNPVFPRFMKILEVSKLSNIYFLSASFYLCTFKFSDPVLIDLLRRKVRLNQPYVGIFMKKEEENKHEVVAKISDVYEIGSFAQIQEMQDLGDKLRCVVTAHRRVKIVGQLIEELEDETAVKGKYLLLTACVLFCTIKVSFAYRNNH